MIELFCGTKEHPSTSPVAGQALAGPCSPACFIHPEKVDAKGAPSLALGHKGNEIKHRGVLQVGLSLWVSAGAGLEWEGRVKPAPCNPLALVECAVQLQPQQPARVCVGAYADAEQSHLCQGRGTEGGARCPWRSEHFLTLRPPPLSLGTTSHCRMQDNPFAQGSLVYLPAPCKSI